MGSRERKIEADKLLYDFKLLGKLNEYGKAYIIGSYQMDMMAWNDLDIYVDNEHMSLEKVYQLSDFIMKTFHPVWYEAKQDIIDGKRCYFQGFETEILGEIWNVDIWFFDNDKIKSAQKYCDDIYNKTKNDENIRRTIVDIKQDLISSGLYSFEMYRSVDVYDAVLNYHIKTADELIEKYSEHRSKD